MNDTSLGIAEAASVTGLTAHTLRYYERIGLIAPVERQSGIRRYGEADLRWLQFLVRLRATGMTMRDMRRYAELMRDGDAADAVDGRLALLVAHAERLEGDLRLLTDTLAYLHEKIARYRTMQQTHLPPSPPRVPPRRKAPRGLSASLQKETP